MSRAKPDVHLLIRCAESLDSKASGDSRQALKALIDQGEAIPQLISYYFKCQSTFALDLLSRVREPFDTELCNRIQDLLAANTNAAITLLGQIVQKSPSWLSKLPDSSLFESIVKLIQPNQNVATIVAVVLFISSAIPHFVKPKRSVLNELFRAVPSTCVMVYKMRAMKEHNKNEFTDIYTSHLYFALIQYFITLYGIYPINLLEYLRNHVFNAIEARALSVLDPVLYSLKIHPNLVKMTADEELDITRWSGREAHDFVADTRHVLVRPCVEPSHKNVAENFVTESNLSTVSTNSCGPVGMDTLSSIFSSSTTTNSVSSESLSAILDRWNNEYENEFEKGNLSKTSSAAGGSSTILSSCPAVCVEINRPPKRVSITQRLNNLIRRRKSCTYNVRSLNGKQESVTESEELNDILIEEGTLRSVSEDGQVEEGLDAFEICSTPISVVESEVKIQESCSTTPATIVALDSVPQMSGQPFLDAVSTSRASSTRTCDSKVAENSEVSLDRSDEPPDAPMNDAESISSEVKNRFSVSSFFKIMNQERFITECSKLRRGSDIFLDPQINAHTVVRASSSPDMRNKFKQELKLIGSDKPIKAGDLSFPIQDSIDARPFLLNSQINEFIDSRFPYSNFMHMMPIPVCDQESWDFDLRTEHERTLNKYMEASADYHTCLKQLNLADRMPAKIYSDMTKIIQGLPYDKQISILNARLALVNQHLMYERCGRLLHAERNRRLFGRIKQQKWAENEITALSIALRDVQIEREQLVGALTQLRKQSYQERVKRDEMEYHFQEEIKKLRNVTEMYVTELENSKHELKRTNEFCSRLQLEVDQYKRRCEDAEIKLLFAEAQAEEMCNLKHELKKANQNNQLLMDELVISKQLDSSTLRQINVDHDSTLLLNEISQLKKNIALENIEKESFRVKAHEYEEEWMQEKQRCSEHRALLEKAKKIHSQQCEAAQHKYLSLLSVCQRQQAHILDLNAKIEELASESSSERIKDIRTLLPRSSINEELQTFGTSQPEYASFFGLDAFTDEKNGEKSDSNDMFSINRIDSDINDRGASNYM